MTKAKFLQRDWTRFSRLGRRKKSKQKWRRPTGRDNKMREKRRGYPVVVSIGYRKKAIDRNKVDGKEIVMIFNVSDLTKVGKNNVAHIGKVGAKKKSEIAKKAIEMKINLLNVNENKLFKTIEKKKKKAQEKKSLEKKEKKEKKTREVKADKPIKEDKKIEEETKEKVE